MCIVIKITMHITKIMHFKLDQIKIYMYTEKKITKL